MQAASTTSIIPFDSGRSYVVRGLPVKYDAEYRFTDRMGRTEKDRRFIEQFERVFLAASEGDMEECQRVIGEGYHDFDAVSFGRFGTASGQYLNDISPLQIAERRKHFQIVELFKTALQDRKTVAAAVEANAANQLKKEELENRDVMRTQIIERELMAFHLSPPAKDKDPADVQYECVKTTSKRCLLYDMSAAEGENISKLIYMKIQFI